MNCMLELNPHASTGLDSDLLQRSLMNVGSNVVNDLIVEHSMDANNRCFGLGHDDRAHGVGRVDHNSLAFSGAVGNQLGRVMCGLGSLGSMHECTISRMSCKHGVRNQSLGAGLVSLSVSHGGNGNHCVAETTAVGGSFNLVHESGSRLLLNCSVVLNTCGFSQGLVQRLLLLTY